MNDISQQRILKRSKAVGIWNRAVF